MSKDASPKKEPGLLGEVTNSKAGTEKINMSMEHFAILENKKILKNKSIIERDTGATLMVILMTKAGTI